MTREEVIRLAKEADAYRYVNRTAKDEPTHTFTVEKLERFAQLVAAAERERCALVCKEYANTLQGIDAPDFADVAERLYSQLIAMEKVK